MPSFSARCSQLGVGLHVGIVEDHHRRLFGDQRGHRLRAGVGAPVGVAHDHLHAVGLEFFLEAGEPAFGQVEIHRHRNVGDGLALERFLERALKRFVETLLRQRRRACRRGQADSEQHCLECRSISSCRPPGYGSFGLFAASRCRLVAPSPRCAD